MASLPYVLDEAGATQEGSILTDNKDGRITFGWEDNRYFQLTQTNLSACISITET